MSHSTSLLAYPDVAQAYDRALESEKGIKLSFEDILQAKAFGSRCNAFRVLSRKENKVIYPDAAHTMHGRSIYDTIFVSVKGLTVTMKKISSELNIEDL